MVINGAKTMNEAADQLKVSRQYFQFLMRGTYVPTEIVADRISIWARVSLYFVNLACGRLPSSTCLSDANLTIIADILEDMAYAAIEDPIDSQSAQCDS